MTKKKKKKTKSKNKGLANIAAITTKSLSSALENFKKNQELKKIKDIKLKKLQEQGHLAKEKKELKILEEKLKKEDGKLRSLASISKIRSASFQSFSFIGEFGNA